MAKKFEFVIVCILLCFATASCGKKEEIVNLSAGCLSEVKAGNFECFEENTFETLKVDTSAKQKVLDTFLQGISFMEYSTETSAVYSVTYPDVLDAYQQVLKSDSFKNEVENREVTDEWDDFEDWFLNYLCTKVPDASTESCQIDGFLDKKALKSSAELTAGLQELFETEIPHSVPVEITTEVNLKMISGDFFVTEGENRVLISDVTIMQGDEAKDFILSMDSSNPTDYSGLPLIIQYKVTNLSNSSLVMKDSFKSLALNGQMKESNGLVGLKNAAKLEAGETSNLVSFVNLEDDDLLVWYSDYEGALSYTFKGE